MKVTAGLSKILYHLTDFQGALGILTKNAFKLTPSNGADTGKKLYFLSCSRIKYGGYARAMEYYVTFTLDGSKLSNNYSGDPYDYWGHSYRSATTDTDQRLRLNENEDRVWSDKPYINNAASYITEMHVLMMGVPRNLVLLAKKLHIACFLYDDKNAWKLQNKAKALDFDEYSSKLLKHRTIRETKDRWAKNNFLRYIKLWKSNDANLFNMKNFKVYDILSYPREAASGLDTDISNTRREDSKELHDLLEIWRTNGFKSSKEFIDAIVEKWSKIRQEHDAMFYINFWRDMLAGKPNTRSKSNLDHTIMYFEDKVKTFLKYDSTKKALQDLLHKYSTNLDGLKHMFINMRLGLKVEASMNKDTLKKSYEMGKQAWEAGIDASALDKEFIKTVIRGLKVGESLPYLKEWQRGWTEMQVKHGGTDKDVRIHGAVKKVKTTRVDVFATTSTDGKISATLELENLKYGTKTKRKESFTSLSMLLSKLTAMSKLEFEISSIMLDGKKTSVDELSNKVMAYCYATIASLKKPTISDLKLGESLVVADLQTETHMYNTLVDLESILNNMCSGITVHNKANLMAIIVGYLELIKHGR